MQKMRKIYFSKKDSKLAKQGMMLAVAAFLFGCLLTASIVLNIKITSVSSENNALAPHSSSIHCRSAADPNRRVEEATTAPDSIGSILQNVKILVVVVAFDFSQTPHLEELLGSYHDVCMSGAHVDVIIHATIAYPVTLIDLWNTRYNCDQFSITVVLKPKSLRLHLVDCHRTVFYEKIHEYDLFVYTEDDIRVTPTTVATYLYETRQIEHMLEGDAKLKPSDFNVGIVRYEYNYPANVVIDDKTRHATQNVTRVYWEHSGFPRPVVPNAVHAVEKHPLFKERFVAMQNHHQGMFLATRQLLLDWKDRGPKCDFATIRDRPGKGSQPTEGTQRVWMSSHMLYGGRHCGVQQVLPKDKFGALTVLHLPNKNYRRVGKYRQRVFSDGTEVFEQPHESLLTAMELHLGVLQAMPAKPQLPYKGIRMVDEVNVQRDRSQLLERRMQEYKEYVKRGGVLSEDDMTKTDLVEDA